MRKVHSKHWGNWMYVAGVGNDPREDRYFNVIKQAHQYDPEGDYVRHWLPELAGLEGTEIHTPFWQEPKPLALAGIHLGQDYPHPVSKIGICSMLHQMVDLMDPPITHPYEKM